MIVKCAQCLCKHCVEASQARRVSNMADQFCSLDNNTIQAILDSGQVTPEVKLLFNYTCHIMKYVNTVAVIMCCLGLTGNVLSVMVLCQKQMRSYYNHILLGLTFFDIVCIVTFFIGAAAGTALYSGMLSYSFCVALYEFYTEYLYKVNRIGYTGTVYTTVLITVERYCAIKWPLKTRRVLTVKKASYSILAILLFAILINTPRFFKQAISTPFQTASGIVNVPLYQNPYYLVFYDTYFWVTVMNVTPFIVIVLFNFLIWKELRDVYRNRRNITTTRCDDGEGEGITRMLLTIVILFLVLNSLSCVLLILGIAYFGVKTIGIESISCLPLIVNSSVNFVIYCTMGKEFRKEFNKILCKRTAAERQFQSSRSIMSSTTRVSSNERTES